MGTRNEVRGARYEDLVSNLRVIDFGDVSPLRSQTIWHAIAEGVSEGSPPTLSFMRPTAPYVSIGYHRRLSEVDLDYCREAGLPVFRRRVGGGPVYLDRDQFFFQVTVPIESVSPVRSRALADLLTPAVEAYRQAGIPDAALDEHGEVVVGEAKICGHAAGQIERAVVVVGNLITAFDHEVASGILAAPHAEARELVHRTMRRHVAAHPADPAAFRAAAAAAYGAALGLTPTPGRLTPSEQRHLARYDKEFLDDDWMEGPIRAPEPVWKVKIRAGVEVIGGGGGSTRAAAALRGGTLSEATLIDPGLNGRAAHLEASLRGLTLEAAHHRLNTKGPVGRRLAAALGAGARSHA